MSRKKKPVTLRHQVKIYSMCRLLSLIIWIIMLNRLGQAMKVSSSNFDQATVEAARHHVWYLAILPSAVTLLVAWYGVRTKQVWAM